MDNADRPNRYLTASPTTSNILVCLMQRGHFLEAEGSEL